MLEEAGSRPEIRVHREGQKIGPVGQNGFNAGIKMRPRHWDDVSLTVGIAGHPPGFCEHVEAEGNQQLTNTGPRFESVGASINEGRFVPLA